MQARTHRVLLQALQVSSPSPHPNVEFIDLLEEVLYLLLCPALMQQQEADVAGGGERGHLKGVEPVDSLHTHCMSFTK